MCRWRSWWKTSRDSKQPSTSCVTWAPRRPLDWRRSSPRRPELCSSSRKNLGPRQIMTRSNENSSKMLSRKNVLKLANIFMFRIRYGGGNSTSIEKISSFQCLFSNLQLNYCRKKYPATKNSVQYPYGVEELVVTSPLVVELTHVNEPPSGLLAQLVKRWPGTLLEIENVQQRASRFLWINLFVFDYRISIIVAWKSKIKYKYLIPRKCQLF